MNDQIEFKKFNVHFDTTSNIPLINSISVPPAEFDVVARKLGYEKTESTDGFKRQHDKEVLLMLTEHRASGERQLDTLRRIIAERDNAVASLKTERDAFHTCLIDGVTYRGNEETIGAFKAMHGWYTSLIDSWKRVAKEVGEPEEYDDDSIVAKVADLKRQLAVLNNEKIGLRALHGAAEQEVESLKRQLAESESVAKSLREQLHSSRERTEQLRGELQEAKAQCEKDSGELTIAWDRVRKLEVKTELAIPEKWQKAIEKCYNSNAYQENPFIDRVAHRIGLQLSELADELEKPEAKR
jgi:hypothetical protein